MRAQIVAAGMAVFLAACQVDVSAPPDSELEIAHSLTVQARPTQDERIQRWLANNSDAVAEQLVASVPDFEEWLKTSSFPIDMEEAIGRAGMLVNLESYSIAIDADSYNAGFFNYSVSGNGVIYFAVWNTQPYIGDPTVVQYTVYEDGSGEILQRRSFGVGCFGTLTSTGANGPNSNGQGKLTAEAGQCAGGVS